MRRKDREVTDPKRVEAVLGDCTCCRIGFVDEGEVYIVPLSFGYEKKEDSYVFYFHGAKEGRKLDLIAKNPRVGFEADTNYALREGDTACTHTARFQSVIGNGVMKMVTEPEEKLHGLALIMEHNTGKKEWSYNEQTVNAVAVFKLEVTQMSCKEHE